MLEQLDLFGQPELKETTPSISSPNPERKTDTAAKMLEKIRKPTQVVPPPASQTRKMEKEATEVLKKSTRGRKSLKEMTQDAELVEIPGDEILFQKQYYGIGEVADMFHVNTSLLRYWETEFVILKPRKNKKGDRFFRPEDIRNLELIYHLLRQRKYTIEGAKEFLKQNKKAKEKFEIVQSLQKIKSFLLEMKASL